MEIIDFSELYKSKKKIENIVRDSNNKRIGITNMPCEIYHSLSIPGASDIVYLSESPESYFYNVVDNEFSKNETPALYLGTAVHCSILESNEFDERYFVIPDTYKKGEKEYKLTPDTKGGKETLEKIQKENEGKLLLTREDMTLIENIKKQFFKNDICNKIINHPETHKEFTIIWVDNETDLLFKARWDIVNFRKKIGMDIKTVCHNGSKWEFSKCIAEFKYYIKAAHYVNSINDREGFIYSWIIVSKKIPYPVHTRNIPEADLCYGQGLCSQLYKKLLNCQKNGFFYFEENAVPAWVYKE